MANITFTSPSLSRDVTVYAVAGDRGTILAVAKANKIPIPFDCQDGECGSCLVEVKILSGKRPYGVALTEKEKEALRQLGKITKEEIVRPKSTTFRRASVWPASVSCERGHSGHLRGRRNRAGAAAAPVLRGKNLQGRLEITSVDHFLAHAIKVRRTPRSISTAWRPAWKPAAIREVGKLFRQLAGYSRLHLKEAQSRAKGHDLTAQIPADYVWPDHATPERTSLYASDADISRLDALRAALEGEKRGYEFYYAVAGTSKLPEVVGMAKEFVKEEAEHVKILEAWIAREQWLATKHHV